MLIGMAMSFALFAALSVTGGNWVIRANQYGRIAALSIFTVLGLSLLFPGLAEKLTAPLVRLGGRLQKSAGSGNSIQSSLLLGCSLGLLWAPCAGPILGLILAGAALQGASKHTLGLLLVFAAGAATSLGVAILAGGKVLGTIKKGLGAEVWIKKALGAAVLAAVAAIATGLDTRVLSKLSFLSTNRIEQTLVDQVSVKKPAQGSGPTLDGAAAWLNSKPLSLASLQGKVVLVDFWTYSCINCLRTLPQLKAWSDRYKDQGLVVVGVHTPEFAFEKDAANVKRAVAELGIGYPVAIDNDQRIWDSFQNQYWPAHYLIDARGRLRSHHFGEGEYEESEKTIQQLLKDIHPDAEFSAAAEVRGEGVEAAALDSEDLSPETYLGYGRQEGFSSTPAIAQDAVQVYRAPQSLKLNQWSAQGSWKIGPESAELISGRGELSYQFHARDLHLVLGSADDQPIRFRVRLEGRAPGPDHGADIDENGDGVIRSHRLYQLLRQHRAIGARRFTIEFLDPQAQAFAFTFG
jgi:cytochrome c biogenesis protein CcdA/thiol-disulfide isomerase/thioredoxin